MSLLETIKLYHRYGLVITPLRGKIPTEKNWQSQKQLPISAFKGVVSAGFVIPKNILVIDVDNHENQNGTASLKKISEDFNFNFFSQATVKIETANKGLHLYYFLNESQQQLAIPNSLAKYPSLEFKTAGRQVVIPESVLENGKKYTFSIFSGEDFSKLSFLPENITAELSKTYTAPLPKTKIKAEDLEADIEYFKEVLEQYPKILTGQRNESLYKLACIGRERAISKQKTFQILFEFNKNKIQPQLGINEVQHCVNSAFKYAKADDSKSIGIFKEPVQNEVELTEEAKLALNDAWKDSLIVDKTGTPSRTKFATHNTEVFLQNLPEFKGRLAVNLFSMDTIWKKPAKWHKGRAGEFDRVLDDDDIIRIREALNKAGYDPSPNHILEACRAVSLRNEYHPVKEYLDNLPEWDRKERLKNFFVEYCGAENSPYIEQVGIKIFTAIVARVYDPGCKFDYLPIIIGDQGLGKSTMLEAIAIKSHWYTDNLGSIDNKDVILRMRSKLIVENAELTMFDKTDVNSVKAFLSRRVDRDRLPYDRLPRDLPRQCVIFATTNKDRFLQDETGNRRMWPIEVKKINLVGIKEVLPLLYSEAIFRFRNKEELFLDDAEAEAVAKQVQEARYNQDDWVEKIAPWLEAQNITKTTNMIIWEECFGKNTSELGFREQARIGKIMRKLGWGKQSVSIDGKTVNGYKC